MLKYCEIVNEQTGLVNIGLGNNSDFYKSIGMELREVDKSDIDKKWYLSEKCPHKTDEEKLKEAKENKYNECLEKAYLYQQNGTVEYKNCEFEMSDSNRKNLSDTEEALKLMGQTSTIWNDKDDNLVELTIDDIQYIRLNLILATIQKLWIEKYPTYKQQIEDAQTVDEVEGIIIDYTVSVAEEDSEIEQNGE